MRCQTERHIIALALFIAGFLVLMVGMAGCDKTPDQWKRYDERKAECIERCKPRKINEWLFGFNNACTCVDGEK